MSKQHTPSASERIATSARRQVKKVRQGRATPTRSPTARPAGYRRISEDDLRDERGVNRQLWLVDELAARQGATDLRWFTDNDTSGGDFTDRAAYDELVLAIAAGEIHTVFATEISRISREELEQAEFKLICEVYGVRVVTCEGDDLRYDLAGGDQATATAAMSTIRQVFAVMERAKVRKRVKDMHRERAVQGHPHTGRRSYGWEQDGMTPRPDEQAHIREAVDRVLHGGAGHTTIAREWNLAGVPTVTGKPWSHQTVKSMLMSPRLAGLRTHLDQVYPGLWEPVITVDEHEALVAKLTSHTPLGSPRDYMLYGGLVACGLCDSSLTSRARSDGVRSYVCTSGPPKHGCGKIKVVAEGLEDAVVALFFARLDSLAFARVNAQFHDPSQDKLEITRQIEAEDAKLDRLLDLYMGGDIAKPKYLARKAEIDAKREVLERRQADIPDLASVLALVDQREMLRRDWGDAPMYVKHDALAQLLIRVPVMPGVRGLNRFDLRRVGDPLWRL